MKQREVIKGSLNGNPNGYVETVPPSFDGIKKFMIVFWFSGLGETGQGTDKDLDRINKNVVQWLKSNDVNAIVLAPQDPSGYGRMSPFVRWALKHYAPVMSAYHFAGLSAGGYQIADMINEEAEFLKDLSTVTPMATNFDRCIAKVKLVADFGIKFWGHAGEADGDPNRPGALARFIGKLQALVGSVNAMLTVYRGMGHSAWNETFDGSGKPAPEIAADVLEGCKLFKWVDKPETWWKWLEDNSKGSTQHPEEPEEPEEPVPVKVPYKALYHDGSQVVAEFEDGKKFKITATLL